MNLADVLDGPDLSEPPAEEWTLLEEVVAVTEALGRRLRLEPDTRRMEAMLFVKEVAPACSLFFGALIWPKARKLAGLPESAGKGGRPRKNLTLPFEESLEPVAPSA